MLSALLLRFFIHADQKHGQFGGSSCGNSYFTLSCCPIAVCI